MYINGKWVNAENGGSFPSINPATGEIKMLARGAASQLKRVSLELGGFSI